MIKEFGKNLFIGIISKSNQNWKPFGTWWSAQKFLPDAKKFFLIEREGGGTSTDWIKKRKIPFSFFQTFDEKDDISNKLELIYKLNLPSPCLLLTSECLIINPINFLENLEENQKSNRDEVYFIKNFQEKEKWLIDYRMKKVTPEFKINYKFFSQIEEENQTFITSFSKGFGSWINSNEFPFYKKEMNEAKTINWMKTIEIWNEASSYYNELI